MIEQQIKARGITNERLLDAFMQVERHLFVPPAAKHFAYNDSPLTIGQGQTISQPYIVAMMIDLLEVTKSDIVLEIGTGSGYQTALLAELAHQVYSIERISSLAEKAKKLLKELGYTNIKIQHDDGSKGWIPESDAEEDVKFDAIIVSAAAPSIPEGLLRQLKEGGRLVIPVGDKFFQELLLVRKENGKIKKENHGGCQFVPLIGKQAWKE